MAAMVRCKACGYIMREDRVGTVCPACGLKAKVFEPHSLRISDRRKMLLDLDAHPILVHFPQTFASILPPLVVFHVLFPKLYGPELAHLIIFTSLALPLTCLGAIASGLFDGRLKVKKLTTPALKQKIAVGLVMLALATANGLIVLLWGFADTHSYVLILSIGCLICAVLLGMMGKKLIPVLLLGK